MFVYLYRSGKFLFAIFSCIPSNIYPLFFFSLQFPNSLPLWRGFGTRDCGLLMRCFGFQSLLHPIFAWPFSSFIFLCFICLFFLASHYPLLPKVCEPCWEDERLTMSSIMNSLRVSWGQYTLLFSVPLLSLGIMGSRTITSPTYIWLTMANHENFKLTGVLMNAPQKINPPRLPWLWQGHASDLYSENCKLPTFQLPCLFYLFP